MGRVRLYRYRHSTLADWTIATPIAAVGGIVIWSTGRAVRYVLSRR